MSIKTEISRIKNNILQAYNKAQAKGANIPKIQNSQNLADTIDSIPAKTVESDWWNTRTKNNTDWNHLFFQTKEGQIDTTLDSSKVTNLFYAFGLIECDTIPAFDFKKVLNASYAFYNSDLKECPSLDFEKVTDISQSFAINHKLEKVGTLNTPSCEKFASTFSYCPKLKEIQSINLSNAISDAEIEAYSNPLFRIFYNCSELINIKFEGSINSSLDLSECPLNRESALSAINALSETTNTKTLKFSSTTFETLTEEEKSIAINKGWTLAV